MGGRCSGLRTWLITRVWVAKAQKCAAYIIDPRELTNPATSHRPIPHLIRIRIQRLNLDPKRRLAATKTTAVTVMTMDTDITTDGVKGTARRGHQVQMHTKRYQSPSQRIRVKKFPSSTIYLSRKIAHGWS